MISPSEVSSRFLLALIVMGITEAFQYEESLSVEDLENLFGEDNCVVGTLSATETGSPLIKPIAFLETNHPSLLKQDNTSNISDKTSMSLVSELAEYHNIKYQYTLTKEEGPSHRKQFGIQLKLGDEDYYAEGASIKKAQHEAARLALNSTTYELPPKKEKEIKQPKNNATPVQKLSEWARKHSESTILYSYSRQFEFESSSHKDNNYHKGMYSKDANVHKVIVKVGEQEFDGEGSTEDAAKQAAASNALHTLQQDQGFCMFDDSTRNLLDIILNSNSDDYSPISLVFEFASKSKLETSFDLVAEEGPAHIKKFVYKCTIGDKFETFGEGTSKKEAKRNAAVNIIEKLKSHASFREVNCGKVIKNKKSKKRKAKNIIKSVINQHSEEEEEYVIPNDIDPISKLIEIQKGKHDTPPTFRLIEEKGQTNKEFFIEVVVGDISFIGSGKNKKTAKRKAAEGMLEKLGYSSLPGKTRITSSDYLKREFIKDETTVEKKPLLPGFNLNSDKFVKLDESKSKEVPINEEKEKHSANDDKTSSKMKEDTNDKPPELKHNKKSTSKIPKQDLVNLSQQLGFRFQFSDFPKGNNSGFVSLLSMTTIPPKVCYGTGVTTEESQNKASLNALEVLYKNQLDLVSQMLRDSIPEDKDRKKFVTVDGSTEIKTIILKDTE